MSLLVMKWFSTVTKTNREKSDGAGKHSYRNSRLSECDSVPFWRRLLCAPEVRGYTPPVVDFSSDTVGLSSQSLEEAAIDSGSAPKLKSVFAERRPDIPAAKCDSAQLLDVANSFCSSVKSKGVSESSCGTWGVMDTRRMPVPPNGSIMARSPHGSTASPLFPAVSSTVSLVSSPLQAMAPRDDKALLQRRKDDRKEQIAAEQRRRKELQRDEEALLESERSRLAQRASQLPVSLTEENLLKHMAATNAGGTQDGSWTNAAKQRADPSSCSDDGSTYIDCDDAIDLQELNRLYEYYKRREVMEDSPEDMNASTSRPGCTGVSSGSVATEIGDSQQKQRKLKYEQQQQRYPLGSRRYIERILLAERSQQVIALMWLLSESMRQAWQLHLKLAQLYTYYVPAYVKAETARRAAKAASANITVLNNGKCATHLSFDDGAEENDALRITQNKYYAYFCSGTFDYEYYVYRFNQEWESIFTAVSDYLGTTGAATAAAASASCVEATPSAAEGSSVSAPRGSVGFAATVLYSMELFERQRELQVAVRDTERWLSDCWHRLNGTTPPPTRSRRNGRQAAVDIARREGVASCDECDGGPPGAAGDEPLLWGGAERGDDTERMHLPMDWWRAQDADIRAHICWNRKKRKLHQIRSGMALLRKTQRCGAKSAIAAPLYAAPTMEDTLPVTLETLSDDRSDEEAQSHRVVSVGCFGFSFFSPWD
ncbi:unnamed protein product [Trypanosoma congolense IL3000]|uniref:WGS project CAEQ00000000 data, annotated contig 1924 n=1 Tax=Trypanosoma congolense (strain IL3000) TaxID=1068625 RepID=F9WA25_TRYCI|nr:unnamed protein product [Trypanosoma congolense IL3000]